MVLITAALIGCGCRDVIAVTVGDFGDTDACMPPPSPQYGLYANAGTHNAGLFGPGRMKFCDFAGDIAATLHIADGARPLPHNGNLVVMPVFPERKELSNVIARQQRKIRLLWIICLSIVITGGFHLIVRFRKWRGEGLHLPEMKRGMGTVLSGSLSVIKVYADLIYTYSHDRKLLERKMYEEITAKIIEELDIDLLCDMVDLQHENLCDKLRSAHPRITQGDIQICYMIIAGFSNQQMCAMLGLKDVNCLYVKKTRLKARLELSAEEKVETYLTRYVSLRDIA